MDLEFFDANVFIGLPTRSILAPIPEAADLLDLMDRLVIGKALVWHVAQHDYAPQEGNRLLSEAIAGFDRLVGCWTVLPPQTEEVVTEDFFQRMKRDRIAALRLFPERDRYLPDRAVLGGFLDETIRRRIPVFLSLSGDFATSWQTAYRLLEQSPELWCVLCDLGSWGNDRYTWPLLEKYPHVFLETGMLSLNEGNLEATVKRFGASRLLFGTGLPLRYPEAAILQLVHAGVPDSDKRKIASDNLESLIAGVEL